MRGQPWTAGLGGRGVGGDCHPAKPRRVKSTTVAPRAPVKNPTIDGLSWMPIALDATLVLAGLYQLTPLKQVCLRQCRSPWGFFAQNGREGRTGAISMGVRHGLYCLGCCWALFAVLTSVGMMSIAWMVSITVVAFAEKVFPHGVRISTAVGFGSNRSRIAGRKWPPSISFAYLAFPTYRTLLHGWVRFAGHAAKKMCRLNGKIFFDGAAHPKPFSGIPGNVRRCLHFLPI
jgi:hypothetical protein